MSDKPEALLLADVIEREHFHFNDVEAAECLRRQHEAIKALEAERDVMRAELEAMRGN